MRRPAPQIRVTGTDVMLWSCTLAVHDLNEALDFYRDVLGFDVRNEPEGALWSASVGPPSYPNVRIFLHSPGADPNASPADRRTIEELTVKGLLSHRLVFVTGDCDATFERIEAAGAEVMQEPIDRPDGTRDCAFFDPSRNTLRFTQPRQLNRALASRQAHIATALGPPII
ncbi:VOC family protein [Actinomadura graeca]|uniref:VOC family protein n=1 Tax=Actinomadura graeca TaxID=2750812 RepID=A0ABX8R494_9ACTN|nr:VOC family protein [Actinomadura graeca]QXJ23828.1 VOC family protein [Actinomadura graeca]